MLLNHYDVLSVDPSADLETIRRAWRLEVRLLHPDRRRTPTRRLSPRAAHDIAVFFVVVIALLLIGVGSVLLAGLTR